MRDRILACLLGQALGDGLGLPYENLSPRRVAALLGPGALRPRMLPGRSLLSDDTEHAFLVGRALVLSGGEPVAFQRHLARGLRAWFLALPPGIGLGTLRACLELCLGVPAERAGVQSAGNGPAMRAPLLGLVARDRTHLRALVRVSTRLTHTDPRAEAGALVIALAAAGADDAELLAAAGPLGEVVGAALSLPVPALVQRLGLERGVSGFVLHTVPVALCLARHHDDLRGVVSAAVRLGGDTDTVAAIAGALVGARQGTAALDPAWLASLADWPLSCDRLAALADSLATGGTPPGLPWPALLLRNLAVMPLVVGHVLRRALPPYG